MALNGGRVKNKGFEFTLNITPVQTKDWSWTVGLNSSRNWNTANDVDSGLKQVYDFIHGASGRILKQGYPLSGFWSYSFKGLNDETGYPEFNLDCGSTVGMITLEDLLEEIVGEIRDEYDGDEVDDIIKVNDTEYIFSGTARLNDIEEYIELPDIETDHESDYDSISGFIIDSLKRLPVLGDEVTIGNLRFVVEGCTKNRITKVHAYILDTEKEPDEENTEE